MNQSDAAKLQIFLMNEIQEKRLPNTKPEILRLLEKSGIRHTWQRVTTILELLDFTVVVVRRPSRQGDGLPRTYAHTSKNARALAWVTSELIADMRELLMMAAVNGLTDELIEAVESRLSTRQEQACKIASGHANDLVSAEVTDESN